MIRNLFIFYNIVIRVFIEKTFIFHSINVPTTKAKFRTKLWAIADILRGKMNADEYKNYILEFIFYKYLSEIQEKFEDKLLHESGEKEFL